MSAGDLNIALNPDGSLTVEETSLEGRRLRYVVKSEDAHGFLVDRGAVCTSGWDCTDKDLDALDDIREAYHDLAEDVMAEDRNERMDALRERFNTWRTCYRIAEADKEEGSP